jgi:hypothetical protein
VAVVGRYLQISEMTRVPVPAFTASSEMPSPLKSQTATNLNSYGILILRAESYPMKEWIMWHWVLDVIGAAILTLAGYVLGWHCGWHSGWKYGYREGWREETESKRDTHE